MKPATGSQLPKRAKPGSKKCLLPVMRHNDEGNSSAKMQEFRETGVHEMPNLSSSRMCRDAHIRKELDVKIKTWLECIEHFDEGTKALMVSAIPHTHFVGNFPPGISFLSGAFVDMGFANLGTKEDADRLTLAFGDTGLIVPGTPYRLRFLIPSGSQVEAADGTENETLPVHWKQGVLVLDNQEKYSWIGKRVRITDQTGKIDFDQYLETEDGWVLAH
jgi:hypothetical protein